MKKYIIKLAAIVVIILSMYLQIYANEIVATPQDTTILDQIKSNGNVYPSDNIFNTQLYVDDLQGYNFENDVILKIYPIFFWEDAGKDIDTIVDNFVTKSNVIDYIIFRDDIIRVREIERENNTFLGINNSHNETPAFLNDIIDSSFTSSSLFDPTSEFTKVMCFDANYNFDGIIVYYVQENSTAIWYYENYFSEHVEFNLNDFNTYAKAYYNSMQQITEDNIENVNIPGFLDFIENYEKHTGNNSEDDVFEDKLNDNEKNTEDTDNNDNNMSFKWYILVLVIVLMTIAIVTIIALCRKNKENL